MEARRYWLVSLCLQDEQSHGEFGRYRKDVLKSNRSNLYMAAPDAEAPNSLEVRKCSQSSLFKKFKWRLGRIRPVRKSVDEVKFLRSSPHVSRCHVGRELLSCLNTAGIRVTSTLLP